jgi:hypothetical protein
MRQNEVSMALTGRLFIVFFAFLAACLAAGITVIMGEWFRGMLPRTNIDNRALDVALWFIFTMIMVGGFTCLPAIIVVAITEAFKIRNALTYAVAGGLFGLASYLLLMPLNFDTLPFFSQDMAVVVSAGVVAGLVYWTIAGRNAGAWRKPPPPPSEPPRMPSQSPTRPALPSS